MADRVIVGTAGHIDHGKSALVRALTGVDPDRLKEEKERGITIELGFAPLRLPSGILAGMVDVPGHEKFVRTMVAGAAGIDIVLLVVAADEGVMPQTREHLDICRLLSVRHGLAALTKCDRVDSEEIARRKEEILAFVRGSFLEGAPLVPVSAATGSGLPDLVKELDRVAAAVEGKDRGHFFRLPVDRSFTMKGFGTVVTGTLMGGTVRVGDEVAVLPGGKTARVRGLQVHGGSVQEAAAGTRTAVNLQGVDRDDAPRGSVLCHPGTLCPTRAAEALVEYLPLAQRPLRHRALLSFHAGTASCLARVLLYDRAEIPPGGSAFVRLEFAQEQVLLGQDRFILRGFAPLANFGFTVGGGRILHPHPPPHRAGTRAAAEILEMMAREAGRDRLIAALADAGAAGLKEIEAAAAAGVAPAAARQIVEGALAAGELRQDPAGRRLWHRTAVEEAGRRLAEALAALHARSPERAGFSREEIAQAAGLSSPGLAALGLAVHPGIAKEADLYHLPEKRPPSAASSPLARALLERVRSAGLAAPTRSDLAGAVAGADAREIDGALDALVRAGAVVRIREFFFDARAVEELRERLVAFLLERKEITVGEFKDLAGLTRRHLIPLLEHFDLARVTLRVGDRRVLRGGR